MVMALDIIAIILSFASLLVSIGVVTYELHGTKKINDINLVANIMNQIYMKYLITEIPEARRLIDFPGNKLCGTQRLQDVLVHLKNDSLFFKYSDNKFFDKLKNLCQDLEDYIVKNDGKKYDSLEEKNAVFTYIEEKLSDLYNLIENKYKNGTK